jgi:hypothetical protein
VKPCNVTRRAAVLLVVVVTMTGLVMVAPADASSTYISTLQQAARSLPVTTEVRSGYARTKFRMWVDADHDGCDTRDEVLIAEAMKHPKIGASCALTDGRWFSYYDRKYTDDPSTFDIDHVVPLAEAWDSGARTWTSGTRQRYANDLGDPRPLVAVTAHANRSKGDQDPAQWLPTYSRCRYIKQWIAVKIRWHLTVDRAERKVLVAMADSCAATRITVDRATVVKSS